MDDVFDVAEVAPIPAVVADLIEALPEWFGQTEANRAYVAAARHLTTVVARDDRGAHIGVLLLARHFATSAELHLMAVDPTWHRRGVGRALVAHAEHIARIDDVRLLSVKTLGPSDPDPGYAGTRAFYEACGFLPLEEITGLWPGSPCLALVKPLS